MDWKGYALAMLAFHVVGFVAVYLLAAAAGAAPAQPRRARRRRAHLGVQHRGLVHDQHQLAGLRRRDDHELPHPDARPDGAELRLGRDRHGHPGRAHPRADAADEPRDRQLLGRPGALHASTSCCRCRSCSRSRWSRRAWCRRSAATRPRPSSRRLPNGDGTPVTEQQIAVGPAASQIAIKQLGTNGGGFFNVNSAHPFENPTPLSQLPRVALDPAHPGGAVPDLRGHGPRPATGVGVARGDAPRPRSGDPHRGGVRAGRATRRSAPLGVDQQRLGAAARRQHGGQGAALRHRLLGALGGLHDRRLQRLGRTRCTTRTRRSAGWSRSS